MQVMEKVFLTTALFWICIIIITIFFTGCGRQLECTKPAIQIADISHNYKHCKDLRYDGKQ